MGWLPWWSSGLSLPSKAVGTGLIPGQGIKIPHILQLKNQNINHRSNIITNSRKTLKMAHIKKKKSRKGRLGIQTLGFNEKSESDWTHLLEKVKAEAASDQLGFLWIKSFDATTWKWGVGTQAYSVLDTRQGPLHRLSKCPPHSNASREALLSHVFLKRTQRLRR